MLPILSVVPKAAAILAERTLEERGWGAFLIGTAVTFFGSVGAGFGIIAKGACTIAMWTALFPGGQPVAAGTSAPCFAAAAISVLSASVAGGLATYGATRGWVTEKAQVSVGDTRRSTVYPIIHNALGISHHFDGDLHTKLTKSHGGMLASHNTTLVSVTWIETLSTANHTGSPLEGLDMTHGRLLTLLDDGVIRSTFSHINHLEPILEQYNAYKGGRPQTSSLIDKRADTLTMDWMSYVSYGENMKEGHDLLAGIQQDENTVKEPSKDVYSWDETFAKMGTSGYPEKYCLSAGPNGDKVGQDSVIVGEVYVNKFGGVDSVCDSG